MKKNTEKTKSQLIRQTVFRAVGILVGAVVLFFAGLLLWLTVTEYKPEDVEDVDVYRTADEASDGIILGNDISILSWNVGYCALGDDTDFFMDGGSGKYTESDERVRKNMQGIASTISEINPDIFFLQEVDVKSDRSYENDEAAYMTEEIPALTGRVYETAFAYNFRVKYIPYPLPPIGEVNSGIMTVSDFTMTKAERIQLPCPFSWPYRLGNLKRCLLTGRVPVLDQSGNDTGKELVLVNLHLEAYDSGEGKAAQAAQLKEALLNEVKRGNYVIAGGDFNMNFSGIDVSRYPEYDDMWHCDSLDTEEFGNEFDYYMDPSVPTCRSLYKPYLNADTDTFQYYMLDGFIVSRNVSVSTCRTEDLGFANADHNPVVLHFFLNEP